MESENMFYLTNEANKIKLSLMLQGMNLLKYNEKNAENEIAVLLDESSKHIEETCTLLDAYDDGFDDRFDDLKIVYQNLLKENADLKNQLENDSQKEKENAKACEEFENLKKLDKRILEEKQKNINLKDSIEIYEDMTTKVKELENFSNLLIFHGYKLTDSSNEIKKCNEYKIYEKLIGIKFDDSNAENNQIVFKLLKEDVIDALFSSEMPNSRSTKRRKLNNQAKGVLVNAFDTKIIFENYIQILCDSLVKSQIEDAQMNNAIDWVEGSSYLTILLNKTSKMARIKLPKFYPLIGTSKIQLISLTGYEDSKVKDFQIETDYERLSQWIMSFSDLHASNLI